jgi:hypothetical protein
MLQVIKNGQASVILRFKILDSSVSTGAGLTAVAFNSSGLIISTIADNEATATAYTSAGSTVETITTLGTYAAPTATKCRLKEVDSTNHKGLYELQLANARLAVSGAKSLIVSISGVTNMAQTDFVVPLWVFDPYASVTQTGDSYARLGAPVGASVSADIAAVDALVAAPAIRSALGMAAANMDTQLSAIDVDIMTRLAASGYTAPPSVSAILTTQMAESYRALGVSPTLAQALCELLAHSGEKAISGTTLTINKFDHTTPAETFTLDSATAPTAITRAT